MSDEELLNIYGWTVICESPYEIEHEHSFSFVKGKHAVEIIIDSLRNQETNRITILDYLRDEIKFWEERD